MFVNTWSLFLSHWLHSVWHTLGSSTSLPSDPIWFLLMPGNTPLCVGTTAALSVRVLTAFRLCPWPASCTLYCSECHFELLFSQDICPVLDFWIICSSVYSFLSKLYYSSYWLYQFTFPPTVREGALLSTSSSALIVYGFFFFFFFFTMSYSDLFEVMPHCSFDLYFSSNLQCWVSFHVLLSYPYVFLQIEIYLGLPPIFRSSCLIFGYWAPLYILDVDSLSVASLANILPPFF